MESPQESKIDSKKIGMRIALLRRSLGVTQKELSIGVGISLRHLQEIESGRTDFKVSHLLRIAEFLGDEKLLFVTANHQDHLSGDSSQNKTHYCGLFDESCILESSSPGLDGFYNCQANSLGVPCAITNIMGKVLFVSGECIESYKLNRHEICGKKFIYELIEDRDQQQNAKDFLTFILEKRPKPMPFIAEIDNCRGMIKSLRVEWTYIKKSANIVVGLIMVFHWENC